MSLVSAREEFARRSGRHDLVTDFAGGDYSDNGADFFLNSGQRYLDDRASFLKSYAWYRTDLAVGGYRVEVEDCISIKEVWTMDSDNGRSKLEKKDLEWLRREYNDPISDLTQGDPAYYSPLVVGLAPEQSSLTAAGGSDPYTAEFTYDWEDLTFGDHWRKKAIWVMPPTDSIKTVSILGRWYSKRLSADTDKTYWTEVHEDLLVLAGMYALERFYRNSEGMRDFERAIEGRLLDIDKNDVEEAVQDLDQMGG